MLETIKKLKESTDVLIDERDKAINEADFVTSVILDDCINNLVYIMNLLEERAHNLALAESMAE